MLSGINTKTSLRVSFYMAIFSFLLLKQYSNEVNDVYFTGFKSAVEILKLIGGDHTFTSADIEEISILKS